jgi:caffeoyl-CoA O-methyltransferase
MDRAEYIRSVFVHEDDLLQEVIHSIEQQGMPKISISPESGKLLTMLVQVCGAKQLLEIGALGGYSGICLMRGSSGGGHLTSLELEKDYAALAHENLRKAGFGEKVKYYIGEALTNLAVLEKDQKKFDLIFIDADKENYSNYVDWAIRLGQPGTLIVADNTLWGDRVLDENETDASTVFLRAYNQQVAQDKRIDSILIPIGDGLTVGRVK